MNSGTTMNDNFINDFLLNKFAQIFHPLNIKLLLL
jgi:hypothetical protein